MASEAAALLDQLMGRNRNVTGDDAVKEEHFSDPEVCKHFLCGFCPSKLFINTRSDIGICDKLHDDHFKEAYDASNEKWQRGYEERFIEYLEKLIRDLDKRVQRGKERLQRSEDANTNVKEQRE
ncbi:PREDICTED: luc7-like protein 3, partial [Amphimedon queenslandica]|uniref:Uncharacterized protein n=1 Tax=Amphimedon queenslandica TaxID=400682 RepID=A0AAN0IKC9_AMPQE